MNIKEEIKKLIDENDICLFMKGTPDNPQCGFSMAVSNVLKHLNVKFKGINVLEDENLRKELSRNISSMALPHASSDIVEIIKKHFNDEP